MSAMNPPSESTATRAAGFTIVELMIGVVLTSVLLAAAMSGVVALQKSYSATEGYGTGLADQTRLLDFLAQDLRRAIPPDAKTDAWTPDADGQGLQITVPDYYRFNDSDPQHLFPIANEPILDPGTGIAYYSSDISGGNAIATVPPTVPYRKIAYRFDQKRFVITRSDPWQPRVSDGANGYKDAGAVVVATSMDSFPQIVRDTDVDTSGSVVRYTITFYSTFQPFAVRGGANTGNITLHNKTFIRSKGLAR